MPERKIYKYASFFIMLGLVVAGLKILNWLPLVAEQGLLREYRDVEEARKKLSLGRIYVPQYFPQTFKWPPSRIFAQAKPFKAIIMEFKDEAGGTAMVISQSASPAFKPQMELEIAQVQEKAICNIKGQRAFLEAGSCQSPPRGPYDVQCGQIYWEYGDYHLKVIARTPPVELVKIAESMSR
jgi:hypothetical protein